MTTPEDIQKNAKHLLYLLNTVQGLRAGEGMDPQVLKDDLDKHEITGPNQKLAVDYAMEQGWLRYGPEGEVQLTEKGFALG